MPWVELKKWPPTQDGEAAFPLDLYNEFDDLRAEMTKLEEELWLEHPECSKFRFRKHFHSFGYGAYCTYWAVEGYSNE